MEESEVRIIAQDVAEKMYSKLLHEIHQMRDDIVRKETCDMKHQEIKEMKADIRKISAMFIAILTGIIIQLVSTLMK